jgi:hypothetical protein
MKKGKPLKRGAPLKAKTPLKGNKPLQAKTPLKQNSQLARSAKAQQLYKEKRIPLVKKLLTERPWCEACPVYAEHDDRQFFRVQPSCDLHEIKSRGRTGGIHSEEWLDEANILCVCRGCHRRITDNPQEAQELGLLKPSGLDK